MPDHTGDEPEERYEQLRLTVLDRHRAAASLEAALPAPPEPVRAEAFAATGRIDEADLVAPPEPGDGEPGDGEPGDGEPGDGESVIDREIRLVRAVEELTEATDALLALEDRLPVLRDVPARAWSLQIVRASALAVLLGGVLIGLGLWRGMLAVWWFPVLLVMLPAAVRMAFMPVAPAAGRHRRQRWSAAVSGVAALLVAPVTAVFGWLPGLAAVVVLLAALATLVELRWVAS